MHVADLGINSKGNHMTLTDTLWSLLVIFFMIMYFMVLFMVIVDLFRDHTLSGWWKAVWIIFLFLVPFLTPLVYLIARGGSMQQRQQAAAQAMDDAQRAYIQQAATGAVSPSDQIASAKALLDAGTISQAEFDTLKAKALS